MEKLLTHLKELEKLRTQDESEEVAKTKEVQCEATVRTSTPDIYKMKLHETLSFHTGPFEYFITRVPGGWLYQLPRLDQGVMTNTFVPYNFESEFRIMPLLTARLDDEKEILK